MLTIFSPRKYLKYVVKGQSFWMMMKMIIAMVTMMVMMIIVVAGIRD